MESSTLEGLDFDLYEVLEVEPSCSINDVSQKEQNVISNIWKFVF